MSNDFDLHTHRQTSRPAHGPDGRRIVDPPPREPRRRRWLLLLAALLLLVAGGAIIGGGLLSEDDAPRAVDESKPFVSSGVVGDTDGDGDLSTTEKEDLALTRASAASLDKGAFPTKGVGTSLLTPAGPDWWRLIVSETPQLKLAEVSPPVGASDWYAMTQGRAYHGLAHGLTTYQSLYLKFDTANAAREWALAAVQEAGDLNFSVRLRGDGLVSLAPVWVDQRHEPLPSKGDLSKVDARMGLWRIDLDEEGRIDADNTGSPTAYAKIWKALGMGGADVSWEATSPQPDAPWVGTISGFRPGDVSPRDVLGTVNTFYGDACRPGGSRVDCVRAGAASEAINEIFVYGKDLPGGGGLGGGSIGAFRYPGAPKDPDIYFATSPSFIPVIAGQRGFFYPPVKYTAWWVKDGKLAIVPVFEDTGGDTAAG